MAIDTETMQLIERIVARSVANATSQKGAAEEIAKGVTQYVGARYVPLFAEPFEWDKTKAYEPLTIVLYQGNSYTSRQYVPVGVELTNESFWAKTGNYNAQVEQYRQEVKSFDGRINANANAITAEVTRATAAEGKLTDDLSAEVTRATAAEGKLTDDLSAEVTRATAAEGKLTDDLLSLALNGKNIVTPFTYGAVGDGVTDDTDSISKCLNSGMTAVLPEGTFYVTDSVVVSKPVTLIGAGGKIKIKSHDSANVYTFNFNDNTTIYGVEFISTHDNTTNGINQSLDNVACSNVQTIACRKAETLNIVNCTFKNMYIAVFSNGIDKNTDVNIENCVFENVYSVIFSNKSNINVANCNISINENANVYYHIAYPSQDGDIDYVKLVNNTVKYNPVKLNIATFISGNSSATIHQSIKNVIISNNDVENMRVLYMDQSNVNISNFTFDSNIFRYDTNVLTGYVSIISFIGGNVNICNSTFINKTPNLYLTANLEQTLSFYSCDFTNFYIVGDSGLTVVQNNSINFNSCTFTVLSFSKITANVTFSNCVINHTGTTSNKTLFYIKSDLIKLILLNTVIIGVDSTSFIFNSDTTENNTHCILCVFENVQNIFYGKQTLVGCIRNESTI